MRRSDKDFLFALILLLGFGTLLSYTIVQFSPPEGVEYINQLGVLFVNFKVILIGYIMMIISLAFIAKLVNQSAIPYHYKLIVYSIIFVFGTVMIILQDYPDYMDPSLSPGDVLNLSIISSLHVIRYSIFTIIGALNLFQTYINKTNRETQ